MEDLVMGSSRRVSATQDGSEGIGHRLARLRKERGITQVDLAARIGTSQPIVSRYERGDLLLHGELIAKLTKILDVSADEILGTDKRPQRPPPLPVKDRRLFRRIQALEKLSKRDREAIIRTLDAFLTKSAAA